MKLSIFTLLCVPLLAGTAFAASSSTSTTETTQPHKHRGPPPEAFAACVGKTAGSKVTVTFHSNSIPATCEMFDGKLAARPDHMPPPRDGGERHDHDEEHAPN